MSYHEREISAGDLEGHLRTLDSDEGIRIEAGGELVFINRTSKRYCIDVSSGGRDEFLYAGDPQEVIRFLSSRLGTNPKIFA